MTKTVRFQIQGRSFQGQEGEGLLDAVRRAGFEVPSLCHHEAVRPYGACRLCLVEVKQGRRRKVTTSCNYPVGEGLEVFLDTEKVRRHRRVVLQLLLAAAPASDEVRRLAARYDVIGTPYEPLEGERCIRCGLCVRACAEVAGAEALTFAGRGTGRRVETPFGEPSPACLGCGACAEICPTGSIGLEDVAGTRHLRRWRTALPLASCPTCGRPVAPAAQLELISRRTRVPVARLSLCPDCRARSAAS